MSTQNDVYFKFNREMLKQLLMGDEVVIQQPDLSYWHFTVDNHDADLTILTEIMDALKKTPRDEL